MIKVCEKCVWGSGKHADWCNYVPKYEMPRGDESLIERLFRDLPQHDIQIRRPSR